MRLTIPLALAVLALADAAQQGPTCGGENYPEPAGARPLASNGCGWRWGAREARCGHEAVCQVRP